MPQLNNDSLNSIKVNYCYVVTKVKKYRGELTPRRWGSELLNSPLFRTFLSQFRWEVHLPESGKENRTAWGTCARSFLFKT